MAARRAEVDRVAKQGLSFLESRTITLEVGGINEFKHSVCKRDVIPNMHMGCASYSPMPNDV